MGCCPRCGSKADTLFKCPEGSGFNLQRECFIHCGCIWSPEERTRVLDAVKNESVNLLHVGDYGTRRTDSL
jgi:hypothetical protein